jgi:BirA family biotin operon repressor/biotin-[acetyl-CoA-carboxylase] ligase
VGIDDDLSAEALTEAMPGRPVRSYPAVLSTEAAALAWARQGAPHGAVVTAGYQASPRGRAGLPWDLAEGSGLAFSLVLRPELPATREGWIYAAAVCGLSDTAGEEAMISWPDEVHARGRRVGAVGAWVELGPEGVLWAVLNVLVPDATEANAPRAQVLARVADAVEHRMSAAARTVLDDYRARCRSLGRQVLARMIPMGPAGPRVQGTAVDVLPDGSLVLKTSRGNRIAVRPQNLGVLDDLGTTGDEASP